jgi:hypothetical protein
MAKIHVLHLFDNVCDSYILRAGMDISKEGKFILRPNLKLFKHNEKCL